MQSAAEILLRSSVNTALDAHIEAIGLKAECERVISEMQSEMLLSPEDYTPPEIAQTILGIKFGFARGCASTLKKYVIPGSVSHG